MEEIEYSLVVKCVPINVLQGLVDDHDVDIMPELAKIMKDEFKWHMKVVVDHIDLAENRLATQMDVIVASQHRLIPKISRKNYKVISFLEHLQQRQVPCIAYITTKDVSTSQ